MGLSGHAARRCEQDTRRLLVTAESLGCVYSGAGEMEAGALLDALADRGARIVLDEDE